MKISRSKQFKKDIRKYSTKMTDKHFEMLIEALSLLINNKKLPEQFLGHRLSGRLQSYKEFHIGEDFVVMYLPRPHRPVYAGYPSPHFGVRLA